MYILQQILQAKKGFEHPYEHPLSVIENELEFHRDKCGKNFAFKRGLQRHIGNVHTHSLLLRSDLNSNMPIDFNQGRKFFFEKYSSWVKISSNYLEIKRSIK